MNGRSIALLVVAALVATPAIAQQQRGTLEPGAFVRYTHFDRSLGLGNTMGVGARMAVYVAPRVMLELDVARSSGDRPGAGSVTHTPLHLRVVSMAPVGARTDLLLGAGYVRNRYSGAWTATDRGIATLFGVRYHVNPRVALRVEATEDLMLSPANGSPNVSYNANLGIHAGVTASWRPGSGAP